MDATTAMYMAMPGCGQSRTLFLDVRPREKFDAGHFANAVWLDLADWTTKSHSSQAGFDDVAGWRARIGALGIDASTSVIVYDDGELVEAARVWYVLQLFGVQPAWIVNGGYPQLIEELPGKNIVRGPPVTTEPRVFAPATGVPPKVGLATKPGVRSVAEAGAEKRTKPAVIWDARTEAEFAGIDARKNPRAGHLPGAVNLPHKQLLDGRGQLRSSAELRKVMQAAGLNPEDALITHCQSGGRAALAALAAVQAGYGDVSNYYMSFGEWAADETCPLVSPATQPAGAK